MRSLLIWMIILVSCFGIFMVLYSSQDAYEDVEYSDFKSRVEQGRIASVTVRGDKIIARTRDGGQIRASFVGDPKELGALLNEAGVTYGYRPASQFSGSTGLMLILPILAVGLVIWVFMRQISAGNNRALAFGKHRARMHSPNEQKVTFDDVAGVEEAKEELREIVDFLKDPKRFEKLGGRIPKGVLLVGAPGTGKTLLAKSVAGEAGVHFFSLSGSDFVEMFVGVGAARVRDLFSQGRRCKPSIIFIDEIDAVGRHRGSGLGGGHDEREQTLNQLLAEMDGFSTEGGVVLLAATNRPDVLDPALLRAGRFDRQVAIDLPDCKARESILKVHARKITLDPGVGLGDTAKATPGFSGADLANIINESALIAARKAKDAVGGVDLDEARDKVCWGRERRSMVMDKEDKRVTACHEAGHALVARLLPNAEPVHKVTIIPRGVGNLGSTIQLPEKDRYHVFKRQVLTMISTAYGGRVAEELVFGDFTAGAHNDIQQATALARKMVCEWGMSQALGPVAFKDKEETLFLGREVTRSQPFSEKTAEAIDGEVKAILSSCYEKAKSLISDNVGRLHVITQSLLDREVLTGDDIDCLLADQPLGSLAPKKVRSDCGSANRDEPIAEVMPHPSLRPEEA